jgi:hypothetical protein
VERRDVGRWFRADERLFVNGEDRSELITSLDQHVQVMEQNLGDAGLGSVPVHAAVCFVDCRWGWLAKPFAIGAVWVAWPQKLPQLVLDWQAMPAGDFERLARIAGSRFTPAVEM